MYACKSNERANSLDIQGEDKLVINSYPGAFTQIISNLVMNSLTHAFNESDVGHIIIRTSIEADQVYLVYSDDGKGMTAETVDKVFEPFFTTRRGKGGSGLGMCILYNLVTQCLQGEVKCDSELNKGVTFTISFPLEP